MATAQISPKAANFPYLKLAGSYGAGQQHEADVEIFKFNPQCEAGEGPGYDRDCEKAKYCSFHFRVNHPEFGKVMVTDWQAINEDSGSKAWAWLTNLGVTLDPQSGDYDPSSVAGRKCILEVGEPNPSKDGSRFYTGYITNVVGLS